MKCPKCKEEVRAFERHCPVCQHDCGYPNVRAAESAMEVKALQDRLAAAEASAARRGCGALLTDFRETVRSSSAVLCRSLSKVMTLVSSDNELYASFYELVGMGARRPEETSIELQRLLADDLVFPHYREQIRFAALSMDGRGMKHYGDCSLVLKELGIQDRATVFEENSLYFCIKRSLGVKDNKVPAGYRATWRERDKLAAAKLESALDAGMKADAFPGIMVRAGKTAEEDEFIEVHIYGPLHRRNIGRLVAQKPKQRADRAILKQVGARLAEIGATVETYE